MNYFRLYKNLLGIIFVSIFFLFNSARAASITPCGNLKWPLASPTAQVGDEFTVALSNAINGSHFPGRPSLSGAFLGKVETTLASASPVEYSFCGPENATGLRVGFALVPGPNARWNDSYKAWTYPIASLKGIEIVYKILVNGSELPSAPVPGLPFFASTPVGTFGKRFPQVTAKISLRATSAFGTDPVLSDVSQHDVVDLPSIENVWEEGSIGVWTEYYESAPNSWQYNPNQEYAPISAINGGATSPLTFSIGTNTCQISSSRYEYGLTAPGRTDMSFTLSPVAARQFTGPGSVVEGGPKAAGLFSVYCYKYDYQNVMLSVTTTGQVQDASSGVTLSDSNIAGRSSNVGVQLLLGLDAPSNAGGFDSVSFDPVVFGDKNLGRAPPGINKGVYTGGDYLFNGSDLSSTGVDEGQAGIYFKARYYKVGADTAAPGVVHTTFTITLNYL